MENLKPNVNDSIIYASDYRSPPSGAGTINLDCGDRLILIQYPDCCPPVKEGYYDEIIRMKNCFSENYNEAHLELCGILEKHGVDYVYDFELIYESGVQDKDLPEGYMTLQTFFNLRS